MADQTELSTDALDVAVSDDGLVVRATIDRPEQRNSLNEPVIRGLSNAIEYADESEARVLVLRGAGGTFCSGGDLSEMAGVLGEGSEAYREQFASLSAIVESMVGASALTVAAVEGYCLAGGLGLAAACEFVVASESAEFGTPEVDVGLFPAQAMAPIMRAADQKAGLKLLFTGEHVDADDAAEMGLVTDVVPDGEFDDRLDDLVDTLANNSPMLIDVGKEAYYSQRDMGFEESLSYLKEVITVIAMSDATEEGINSFLMDERPDWEVRE
ncbi:enoyl-CoA hydratase/isomerase family protein [Halorientalis halophila]|uniref:enoyl-CoA hydratase/isomerase family protein n=1 Tax=Halorientalis halophila TaxID=3108499 RepID=UPI0030091502